ncbi:hypothetical protein O4H49_03370 [Kiloniella laminariae]|uniref:Sel1 repeat family protein n=1 Tax=Kiloniella laminariae TaxID=454162 RepID=A0ABT4LFD1_9PROT|nr:hypothetical protein [Kiloniella laminariae]
MGFMYLNGEGVTQDDVFTHMWWNIAGSAGDSDAVKDRGILERRMTAAQIAEAEKLARECIARDLKGC